MRRKVGVSVTILSQFLCRAAQYFAVVLPVGGTVALGAGASSEGGMNPARP